MDKFATQRLTEIDPGIVRRANEEYWDWIQENYRAGKIGVKRSREEILDEKVKALESEQSKLKGVLNPAADESLADAAARVVTDADDLAEKLQSNATELAQLKAEREQLSAERNQYKTEALEKTGLLARIQTMLGIKTGEMLVPDLEQVVGEANQVPALRDRIETLEKDLDLAQKSVEAKQEKVRRLEEEIEPLRALGKLVKIFLLLLMESPFALKLDAKLKEIAQEIGTNVGISFAPKKKQGGPQII